MKRIEIYTTGNCPYCIRAKALLKAKNLKFKELDVIREPELMIEMIERSKNRTVPQIFINDTSIGGFDELASLNKIGELDQYLDNVRE